MTTQDRARVPAPAVVLAPAAEGLAESLARYSQALIDEATPDGADRSVAHWRAAVQGDPTNVALRVRLGAALLQRKEVPEAVRILEGARALAPDSGEVRLLLGNACQLSGQWRAAEREFRGLIRIVPEQADGYVRLAALYLDRAEPARAMRVLDEGLTHPPASVVILQFIENLGRLHLGNGHYRDAIGCFERLRERIPDSLPLREVLARCYALVGDRARAIAELEELQRLDPRKSQVAFYLAELYEEAGRLDQAEAAFEQATLHSPADAAPFLRLAFIQLHRNRDRALATLKLAMERFPDDPLIYAYLGLLFSRDGKYEQAIESFARSEALVAKSGGNRIRPAFYFWYGAACERAGRYEQAERLLEACIEGDAQADDALNYLAYTWAERAIKLDKALEYVTRALAISPDDGAYVDTLGWVYFKLGEYEKALKALRRALKLSPGDATIPAHVAEVLEALGRSREARRYWIMSLRAEPDSVEIRTKARAAGIDPDAVLKRKP